MRWNLLGALGGNIYSRALDGLKEPAALLDADGKILFANRALLTAQGCSTAGGACRKAGAQPCDECLARGAVSPEDSRPVSWNGRVYDRSVSRFEHRGRPAYTALWREVTASAESSGLMHRQYDKMRRDIFHARSIQFSLLPKELAKAEGYVFRSLYKPSEEMSGDIFDLVRIGRDNMAFYIADVAGHGVTAAMLTVFFSTAVRLEMRPTDMPGRVLGRIHNRFMGLQLEEQHYITAFLGRIELSTGKLFWSNAGHICPPLLMDGAGSSTALEMAGLPICRWFKGQEYETASGQMEPGGRLVLYSDGLESQWYSSGNQEDLAESVGGIMAGTDPEDCLERIWSTAGAGAESGRISDDTTLLMVSRNPGGGIEEPVC